MKSILSLLIALTYSFTATAGTIFDARLAENAHSAKSYIRVTSIGDNVQIQYKSSSGEEELTVPLYILRIVSIRELTEQAKVFEPKDIKVDATADDYGTLATRTAMRGGIVFLGFAPFLGPGSLLLIPLLAIAMGVPLFFEAKELHEKTITIENQPLDISLLTGSSSFVLKALENENVAAIRPNEKDILGMIMVNVRAQSDRFKYLLNLYLNNLPAQNIKDVTKEDLARVNSILRNWEQAFSEELPTIEIMQNPSAREIRLVLNKTQMKIVNSASSQSIRLQTFIETQSGMTANEAQSIYDSLRVLTAETPQL